MRVCALSAVAVHAYVSYHTERRHSCGLGLYVHNKGKEGYEMGQELILVLMAAN
jgi:hypothetical protein